MLHAPCSAASVQGASSTRRGAFLPIRVAFAQVGAFVRSKGVRPTACALSVICISGTSAHRAQHWDINRHTCKSDLLNKILMGFSVCAMLPGGAGGCQACQACSACVEEGRCSGAESTTAQVKLNLPYVACNHCTLWPKSSQLSFLPLLALCLLEQAAAVAEKTAAPAQTRSEYDLITLTSFLLKVRHQPLLASNARCRLALRQGSNESWVASRAADAVSLTNLQ